MGQMSLVMESQPAPSIGIIESNSGIRLERANQAIQSIIVAGGSIRNIPWRLGVVKAVGVSHIVCKRHIALVCMHVAGEYQVNVVFDEVWLEDVLAIKADSAAFIGGAYIPRAMGGCFCTLALCRHGS